MPFCSIGVAPVERPFVDNAEINGLLTDDVHRKRAEPSSFQVAAESLIPALISLASAPSENTILVPEAGFLQAPTGLKTFATTKEFGF